jgi:hypothetical protein
MAATTWSCCSWGRSRPSSLIAVAGAAIFLVGCAAQQPADPPIERFVLDWSRAPPEPPLRVNYPPGAFVVRWTAADGPVVDPKIAAERHCQAWDGHAELVAERASGDEFTAEFVCKDVPRRFWEY